MHPIRNLALATAAVSALALAGCTVHGTTGAAYGYGYSNYPSGYVVYDSYPPVYVDSYPRYWYNGSYAYLVGDRWYVPYGGGWGYLSIEPPVLYGYRAQRYRQYGFSSPPAYGRAPPAYGRSSPYVAPPAYGRSSPYVAPPAYGRPAPPAQGGGPRSFGAPPAYGPRTSPPPMGPVPHAAPVPPRSSPVPHAAPIPRPVPHAAPIPGGRPPTFHAPSARPHR